MRRLLAEFWIIFLMLCSLSLGCHFLVTSNIILANPFTGTNLSPLIMLMLWYAISLIVGVLTSMATHTLRK